MTASRALVACFLLLLCSTNSEAEERWVLTGPAGGYASDLVYDPATPSIVYAASGAGLFRSTDGGGTWALLSGMQGMSVYDVEISSADPMKVYAVTNYGLFRSVDRGLTFALRNNDSWTGIEVSQLNADQLYGVSGAVVRRSTDGGSTWGLPGTGLPGLNVSEMAAAPSAPDTVYIGSYEGLVYKTVDGGSTWQPTGAGLPTSGIAAIIVDPTNPSIVYVGAFQSAMFKTVNGGTTWSPIFTGLGVGVNYQALAISRTAPQSVLAGSNFGVYLTTNGGTNWTLLPGMDTAFSTAVAIDPVDRSRILFQAHDTLYRSTNMGSTSAPSAQGYTAVSVNHLARHPTNPQTLYVATGTGVFRSTDGARTWTELGNIQYAYQVLVNPLTPSTLYVAAGGTLLRSVDNGVTFTPWAEGLPSSALTGLAFDVHTGTVYAGNNSRKVFRRTGAAPWEEITNGITPASMRFVVVDPSQAGVIYAGGGSNSLYRTLNSGANWEKLPLGEWIYDVQVDPFDSRHLLVQTSGQVWESLDQGGTWEPLNIYGSVTFDPVKPGVVWSTMTGSVSRSSSGHRSLVGTGLGTWPTDQILVARDGSPFITSDPGGVFRLEEQSRRRAVRR